MDKHINELLHQLQAEKNLKDRAKLLAKITDYYITHKQYLQAIEHQKALNELNSRIFAEQYNHELHDMQTKYEISLKEKDEEILKLKDFDLKNILDQMKIQRDELLNLNKTKDSILSIVSHDLRGAIGGIHSVVDLIMLEDLNENLRQYIDVINQSSERAIRLVNDILDTNLIDHTDFALELSSHSLQAIIKTYENHLKIIASRKALKVHFTYSSQDDFVMLNVDRFWQIVENLSTNAVKFCQKKANIFYEIFDHVDEEGNTYCALRIRDEGIGIPDENLIHLFDKFTKASRKGTSGEATTGLGLSIVKRLVELHHAKITVESKEDEGTSFTIYFVKQK